MNKSRATLVSFTCLGLGGLLILIAISKTVGSQTAHYWPVWLIGTLIAFITGPLYYYFKSRDKTSDPYSKAGTEALAAVGKSLKNQTHKERK